MLLENDLQRSRVTECLSQVTSDLVLRRKVDFLKKLWRDGDRARSLDLPQGSVCVHAAVQVVACTFNISYRAETSMTASSMLNFLQDDGGSGSDQFGCVGLDAITSELRAMRIAATLEDIMDVATVQAWNVHQQELTIREVLLLGRIWTWRSQVRVVLGGAVRCVGHVGGIDLTS